MKKKSACRTSFFMLNYIHLYSITEFLMKNGEADMLYFIANETARTGKGEGVWRTVQKEIRARKVPYKVFMTKHNGHATELAKMVSEMEEEDINLIVVGGDGTLNEVINGVTDFEKVRISLIPAGSGNDFARNLGITKEPIVRLEHILSIVEKAEESFERIDLGQVEWGERKEKRLYAISSGVGMDALVCKKMMPSKVKVLMNKLGLGKVSYLIVTIQSLFGMEKADMAINIDGSGTQNFKGGIFAAAMNAKAEGGGVPMAPKASVQDGLLSVCIAHKFTKVGALFRLPFLAIGKHQNFHGFKVFDCKNMKIKIKKPMALHTDGEYLGDVTELTYSCLPGKMRFMV